MSKEIIANWIIKLQVECPHCKNELYLTDYISMCELPDIESDENLDFDTYCPICNEEFTINKTVIE